MILDRIIASTAARVALKKQDSVYKAKVYSFYEEALARGASSVYRGNLAGGASLMNGFKFEKALRGPDLSFICEVKRASPSKGIIAEDFPFLRIAKEYEEGGAAAISVLTEPDYFLGDLDYLRQIRKQSGIPVLQKDFIIDEFQIYEAAAAGADAILLIGAVLDRERMERFIRIAGEYGLSCLTETRDEREIEMALACGATVIGVNNRNLQTFEVDLRTSEKLRLRVPNDKVFVSESGIESLADVVYMKEIGADAVLVGETLMRCADRTGLLREMRTAASARR
ncbi:MAG: indole-3-glycerol phosphate synthase TrpC [Saccharofermentanales bacterium]